MVAYKANWLSAAVAGVLLKIKYVSLVNIVLDREAQPEFLQHRCTPGNLARAVAQYLDDPTARETQIEACKAALTQMAPQMTPDGTPPSVHAARAILAAIGRNDSKGAGEESQKSYTVPPAATGR